MDSNSPGRGWARTASAERERFFFSIPSTFSVVVSYAGIPVPKRFLPFPVPAETLTVSAELDQERSE